MSTLIDQVRRARHDYMTNVYNGHGDVKGFMCLDPLTWNHFRAEVQPHMMTFDNNGGQPLEFEGISISVRSDVEKSFVNFMFSHDKPPISYSLATSRHYWLV